MAYIIMDDQQVFLRGLMGLQEVSDSVDSSASREPKGELVTVSTSSNVLAAHPGEHISFSVSVEGPAGHRIRIIVGGLPTHVASIATSPSVSIAPFTSTVVIYVSHGAPQGSYPFRVVVQDVTRDNLLSLKHLILLVLERKELKGIAEHYSKLVKLYKRYGAQAAIWYILRHVFPQGASFSQVKHAYEVIVGKRVSNGTIGNHLKRLKKKRIIIEEAPGVYIANIKDFKTLLSRIDVSRVHVGNRNQDSRTKRGSNQADTGAQLSLAKLPQGIRRVWERAKIIAEQHNALAALYFLLHSLLGAEATGYLLYWLESWFIVCRLKTGFCYHFYSTLLHEMLRKLGLSQGIQYNHFNRLEHSEAQKIARRYIKEYYRSHQVARRLHYMLKELGYIEYDNDVYTLKIYHYPDNTMGLEIYDDRGGELLHSDSIREDLTPNKVETKTAFPFEHVDEQNEDTYFIRPAGLY